LASGVLAPNSIAAARAASTDALKLTGEF